MRVRTTAILALLLVALGAYVYWIELPKAEQEAKKKTLFEFSADDVTEVALVYPDREIVAKKTGEEWRLTKPLDVAADSTTVRNLINAITEAEIKKTLDNGAANLAQYGLDQPFAKVTVKLKDKELPTILVGKTSPVGFSTYVQKAGEPAIFLTSSAFHAGMDKKVKDLRDKSILNFTDKDVQKIDLQGDGGSLTLVAKDDHWSIEQPGPYAADATTVRSFLTTLRSLRAVDFPADEPTDLSTYGLDNPRLKISLYLGKDLAQKDVLIGGETDKKEVYVQASGHPTIYTVSDWVLRDLNKKVGDFRDKTIVAFERDKITAVDVKHKDGSHFTLVRGDDKHWHVEGAGDGKPSDTAINQYLTDLHDLAGYEVLADQPSDLSQYSLDQPLLTLAVSGEDHKVVGTALVGTRQSSSNAKEYTAMAAGGPTVFLVRDYLVTRLDKQADTFVLKPTPTPGGTTPTAPIGAIQPDDQQLEVEPGEQDVDENAPGNEQD